MTNTDLKSHWSLDPHTTYLNHGSFGPSPVVVQEARERWSRELESQPMSFFCQRMERELETAATETGAFIGAKGGNLLFVDNATVGMNIAATAFDLSAGDEILLTDHEYGAVQRIWKSRCEAAGAQVVTAPLPFPLRDVESVVNAIMDRVTDRTQCIVVSHITSKTAAILPVQAICAAARSRGVPVCIDGPHAVAMTDIDLKQIGCDFYTASCHKWLCAPFGSGFLYVHPRWQPRLRPVITSWGGSIAGRDRCWKDEFLWSGTRDPAVQLSVPAAIRFMKQAGLESFRQHGHELVSAARDAIGDRFGARTLVPDSSDWFGTMITLLMPTPSGWEPATHGKIDPLQQQLRDEHHIEVPVFGWNGNRCLRVSAHLYNSRADIDRLVAALGECTRQ